MEVKQAVLNAKQYVQDVFGGEKIENLGIEEVEFDDAAREWRVTLGFSRPWDKPGNALTALLPGESILHRSFKVVRLDDATGTALGVKDRRFQP